MVDVVRSADDRGVALAVEHLAGLGHRDIAFVDGGRGTIAADRRRGYRSTMRRLGLEDSATVVAGDHTEAAGSRAAALLLAEPTRPTAVVASNDRCAVGLLDAVRRAGLAVPQSLSVAGYDDSTLSRLAHIDLTTVNQDPRAQAEQAVALAVQRLDGERTTPREAVLPPTSSSAAAPPPRTAETPSHGQTRWSCLPLAAQRRPSNGSRGSTFCDCHVSRTHACSGSSQISHWR